MDLSEFENVSNQITCPDPQSADRENENTEYDEVK